MHGKTGTDIAVVVPILVIFLVGASRCGGSNEQNMGNGSNMTVSINSGSGDMSNDSNSSLTTESTMSSTLLSSGSTSTISPSFNSSSHSPSTFSPTSVLPTSFLPTSSLPLSSTPTSSAPTNFATMEPTSILTLSLMVTLGVTGVILLVFLLIFLGCVCYCCYLKKKEPANWGHVAKSGDEDITTTQCEAYELTKLGHEYEDLSEYQNPEYEIPFKYENPSGYQNPEYEIPFKYENPSGYQNPEYEIPVTQCSAYGLTSKPGE